MTRVDELEDEVEASRARLDRTLDSLQTRLRGGNVVEDLVGLRRPALPTGETYDRVRAALRRDPLPVLLVCAGLGWILYDAATRGRRRAFSPGMPGSDAALAANQPRRQDAALDEALEETFPSSDPISVRITR